LRATAATHQRPRAAQKCAHKRQQRHCRGCNTRRPGGARTVHHHCRDAAHNLRRRAQRPARSSSSVSSPRRAC